MNLLLKVIYKMDKFGQGEEISMKQVLEPGEVPGTKLSFGKFESDMFLGEKWFHSFVCVPWRYRPDIARTAVYLPLSGRNVCPCWL